MNRDASEYAEADVLLLAVNVSDDELERAAAVSNSGRELTLAYCTLDWVCPL